MEGEAENRGLSPDALVASKQFGMEERSMNHRKARRAFAMSLTIAGLALGGCEKFALDRQMEALCKKDGGVKVYETVTLPPEMFDKLGHPFPGWPNRSQENRLGPDYQYVVDVNVIKSGEPLKGEGRLSRYTEKIYRRSDQKLIGESVLYGRSGGDFIAFAHPTSRHCPVHKADSEGLIKSVFLKKGS